MTTFKVVIGMKDGKCLQKEFQESQADALIGKKIGDTIQGDELGFSGYEFLITGGSDHCGFPMRFDVLGEGRKRILAIQGVGVKKKGKGQKQRKTVCGNTIHEKISQINLKVTKSGSEPLVEKAPEATKDAPAEAKKD